MSLFHFCLSAAKNLSSFQLLPTSLITHLLQLFFGLPLFLFPWGFQCMAAFGISPSSFLNVWPIHLNFLISKFISSCSVAFHRSLLEIIFGHHILSMYLRHLFTKVCILHLISFVTWILLRMRNFQTEVVKNAAHVLCSVIFFFQKSCSLWDNVEPDRPQMTIWRMHIACWITKATNTHSECVIHVAFPQ